MKQLILSALTLLLTSYSLFSQTTPVIVVESHGKIQYMNSEDKKVNLKSGATLNNNASVTLKENCDMLILKGSAFLEVDKAGTTNLAEVERTGMASFNFDPLFGEYLKSAIALTMVNTATGNWDVKMNKERGDGWGDINTEEISGWGVSDRPNTGGWGVNDRPNSGGWGVNDPDLPGGWGVNDITNSGGWGVTERPNSGGWGVNDPDLPGGWGVNDRPNSGGWGVNDIRNTGGWGVEDMKDKSGWGVNHPKVKNAWGVNERPNSGGWGVEDRDLPGGWGVEDMTIIPQTPGGYYSPKINRLNWLKVKGVDRYMFCIFDKDQNMRHSEVVKSPLVFIDFSKVDRDTPMYWQVLAENKKAITPPMTFIVLNDDEYQENIELSENSNIFDNADNEVKMLMKAVSYEHNKMNLDAYLMYEALLNAHGSNDLIRMCYAAFCYRMGQGNRAGEIIKKI